MYSDTTLAYRCAATRYTWFASGLVKPAAVAVKKNCCCPSAAIAVDELSPAPSRLCAISAFGEIRSTRWKLRAFAITTAWSCASIPVTRSLPAPPGTPECCPSPTPAPGCSGRIASAVSAAPPARTSPRQCGWKGPPSDTHASPAHRSPPQTPAAKQVAGQLKVGIGTARRLKAAMGVRQAGGKVSAIWRAKKFVRPPASRGEALRRQHFEGVAGGAQMFRASQRQIRLHRRTQRIDVAIGVPAGEHVAAIRQRIVILIIEILTSECAIAVASAALIRDKQVFRNRVGLVPGISHRRVLAPPSPMLHGLSRQVGQRSICCALQNREGVRITDVLVRIYQPAYQLVVAVRRKTILLVKIAGDRPGVQAVQPQHLVPSGWRTGDGVAPRQRGNPLAKSAAGAKPTSTVFGS